MARLIKIQDKDMQACIAPENGGMLAQLSVQGTDLFKLDEAMLDISPMTAGGCPVLFPFAGRLPEDSYNLSAKKFYMPVHGLVKNAAFAVEKQCADTVLLRRCSCASEQEANYPFAYTLELEYRIEWPALLAIARITNHSSQPMPHAMGWHPYFKASNKHALVLQHTARQHYDYYTCTDFAAPREIDLAQRWDDVFHDSENRSYTLENLPDGYKVNCIVDGKQPVLVVCTTLEGAVCIEPWTAFPDPLKADRYLQWVQPSQVQELRFELVPSVL